jgi:hypothetical protein
MLKHLFSVGAQLSELRHAIAAQAEHLQRLEVMLSQKLMTPAELAALNPHFSRNFLASDDAAVQKNLIATWRLQDSGVLNHLELVEYGFRVFSQNDEDGILLRLLTHIGTTNCYVIEIGSNCSGSDVGIPENLSTNLIVNHGWHGAIFEMDETECARMRYFFARDHSTRHFHWVKEGQNSYFSPQIVQQVITPENIDEVLIDANSNPAPDLMVIDIDGGDYAVIESLGAIKPRVLVVEFEKRFRDRFSVVQFDRADFSRLWHQSGAASLLAWQKLLASKEYILCAIGSCGFNAFFVRADVAEGKIATLSVTEAFSDHPIFSRLSEDFWLVPDETWTPV